MIHCSFLISESVPLGHLSFNHKRAVHLYLPSNFPEHTLRRVQNQTKYQQPRTERHAYILTLCPGIEVSFQKRCLYLALPNLQLNLVFPHQEW